MTPLIEFLFSKRTFSKKKTSLLAGEDCFLPDRLSGAPPRILGHAAGEKEKRRVLARKFSPHVG